MFLTFYWSVSLSTGNSWSTTVYFDNTVEVWHCSKLNNCGCIQLCIQIKDEKHARLLVDVLIGVPIDRILYMLSTGLNNLLSSAATRGEISPIGPPDNQSRDSDLIHWICNNITGKMLNCTDCSCLYFKKSYLFLIVINWFLGKFGSNIQKSDPASSQWTWPLSWPPPWNDQSIFCK